MAASVTHKPKGGALLTGTEYEASDSHVVSIAHSDTSGITATDHHAAPAAGPDANVTIDTAGAAGTASTFARSGHGHQVATDATAQLAVTPDGTATAGTSGTIARSQHQHGMATYASNPAALGSVSAGTSGTAPSRGDHVHPTTGLSLTGHAHTESDVTSLTTDLAAKLASADYRMPVEDPTFELAGGSRMTLPGSAEMFFATTDRQFRMSAAYAQSITVPNGYWRLHYRELQLTAANRLSCIGTSDFVLTDLSAPTGRLTLAGRF